MWVLTYGEYLKEMMIYSILWDLQEQILTLNLQSSQLSLRKVLINV